MPAFALPLTKPKLEPLAMLYETSEIGRVFFITVSTNSNIQAPYGAYKRLLKHGISQLNMYI